MTDDPTKIIHVRNVLDETTATKLRERFREAMGAPVTILTPLPRRVRLRLWLTGRIDTAAIWLVDHHHVEAAIRLWRICGMW